MPEIDGAVWFTGAPISTTALGWLVTDTAPPEFVPVTVTSMVSPTSFADGT